MEFIEAKSYKHIISIYRNDVIIFEMPYQIVVDGLVCFADRINIDGLRIEARIGETLIQDTISVDGPIINIDRKWSLRGRLEARVLFNVIQKISPLKWIVPGSVYSRDGDFSEYTSAIGPIREEATTVPCCTVLESKDSIFGIYTQPSESIEELCSVTTHLSSDNAEFSISIPGIGPDSASSGSYGRNEWDVDGQVTYERSFYILSAPINEMSWLEFIESAKSIDGFETELTEDITNIVRSKSQHLLNNFLIERHDAIGFVESIGRTMYPVRPWLRGSGQGGNIEAARALYKIGKFLENNNIIRIALDTADFFVSHSNFNENINIDYKLPLRKWYSQKDETSTIRMLISLLKLNLETGHNSNPRWLFNAKTFAGKIIDEIKKENDQNQITDTGRTIKASYYNILIAKLFFLLFTCTKEIKYFEISEYFTKKLSVEIDNYILPMMGFDPLTRSEAVFLLSVFIDILNQTKNNEYLDSALKCAHYIDSLAYSYNIPFPPESKLSSTNYSTKGGIAEYPSALWLDPYCISCVHDLLRLHKITNNDKWRKLSYEIVNFSLQEIPINRNRSHGIFDSLEGFQPEKFYHSGETEPGKKFGETSVIAVSAVPVNTLNSLFDIKNEFSDFIDFDIVEVEESNTLKKSISKILFNIGLSIKIFS